MKKFAPPRSDTFFEGCDDPRPSSTFTNSQQESGSRDPDPPAGWKQDTELLSLNLSPSSDCKTRERLSSNHKVGKEIAEELFRTDDPGEQRQRELAERKENQERVLSRPSRIKIPSIKELEEQEMQRLHRSRPMTVRNDFASDLVSYVAPQDQDANVPAEVKPRCKTNAGFYSSKPERASLSSAGTDPQAENNFREALDEKYRECLMQQQSHNEAAEKVQTRLPAGQKRGRSSQQGRSVRAGKSARGSVVPAAKTAATAAPKKGTTTARPKPKQRTKPVGRVASKDGRKRESEEMDIALLLKMVTIHIKECPKFAKQLRLAMPNAYGCGHKSKSSIKRVAV